MLDLKMKRNGGGRMTAEEIIAAALEKFSVDLVVGVDSVAELTQATRVRDWVASFLDARSAYYIHQNNSDFIQLNTGVIPQGTGAKDVLCVFSMGMGFGSVLPQPTGYFEVLLNNTQHLISINAGKEDRVWRDGDVTFHYWIKRYQHAPPNVVMKMDAHITEESMATYGLGFLKMPKSMLEEGRPAVLRFAAKNRQPSARWLKLDVDLWARLILKAALYDGLAAVCAGREELYPKAGDYKVYFGDIHNHSGDGLNGPGTGCGTGSLDENFTYARDIAGLDIYALSEHDWQMDEDAWKLRIQKCDDYNEDGKFVTIPSFEWTSGAFGHRCVYYRDSDNCPLISSGPKNVIQEGLPTPGDLWMQLKELGAKAITVPHHHNVGFFPVDWTYKNLEFDRLIETYSTWGNSEYHGNPHPGWASDREDGLSTQDALSIGHRFGFLASSDGHDGNPGDAQWSWRQPHIHHHLGSGFIAVMAKELTREAIFDAMYARRCYATTGVRIVLDFCLNEAPMGSQIKLSKPTEKRIVKAYIRGTTELKTIDLVRSNVDIDTMACRGREAEFEFEDSSPVEGVCWYYLRVTQEDEEMAWSSPVWVDCE